MFNIFLIKLIMITLKLISCILSYMKKKSHFFLISWCKENDGNYFDMREELVVLPRPSSPVRDKFGLIQSFDMGNLFFRGSFFGTPKRLLINQIHQKCQNHMRFLIWWPQRLRFVRWVRMRGGQRRRHRYVTRFEVVVIIYVHFLL